MNESGIKTMIVSCNEQMGADFIGRIITADTVTELENMGVDACGENGEFHTLVLDCPLFNNELSVEVTGRQCHENYWFGMLQLKDIHQPA